MYNCQHVYNMSPIDEVHASMQKFHIYSPFLTRLCELYAINLKMTQSLCCSKKHSMTALMVSFNLKDSVIKCPPAGSGWCACVCVWMCAWAHILWESVYTVSVCFVGISTFVEILLCVTLCVLFPHNGHTGKPDGAVHVVNKLTKVMSLLNNV